MKIIYLKPHSSFHNVFDSDMLWGLLLNAKRLVESVEKTNEIVEQCEQGKPPFIVSDSFPYYLENNEKKILLPKILQKSISKNAGNKEFYDAAKKYKKVKYLSLANFESIVNGEKNDVDLLHEFNMNDCKDSTIDKHRLKKESTTHTSIDRLTSVTADIDGKGQLYSTEDTFITNGGLYFLYQGDISLIEPALNYLSHSGFGADASTGKGHFIIDVDDFEIRIPDAPSHFVNLSAYLPTELEIDNFSEINTHYDIAMKSGKMSTQHLFTNSFQKKPIFYLRSGGSFPTMGKKYYGKVKELDRINDISIKFNGFAFAIPAKLKEDYNAS